MRGVEEPIWIVSFLTKRKWERTVIEQKGTVKLGFYYCSSVRATVKTSSFLCASRCSWYLVCETPFSTAWIFLIHQWINGTKQNLSNLAKVTQLVGGKTRILVLGSGHQSPWVFLLHEMPWLLRVQEARWTAAAALQQDSESCLLLQSSRRAGCGETQSLVKGKISFYLVSSFFISLSLKWEPYLLLPEDLRITTFQVNVSRSGASPKRVSLRHCVILPPTPDDFDLSVTFTSLSPGNRLLLPHTNLTVLSVVCWLFLFILTYFVEV